jgi:hypothetical protein
MAYMASVSVNDSDHMMAILVRVHIFCLCKLVSAIALQVLDQSRSGHKHMRVLGLYFCTVGLDL